MSKLQQEVLLGLRQRALTHPEDVDAHLVFADALLSGRDELGAYITGTILRGAAELSELISPVAGCTATSRCPLRCTQRSWTPHRRASSSTSTFARGAIAVGASLNGAGNHPE